MLLPSGWSQNVWDQLLRGLGAPTFSSETVSAQRATSMVAHVRFATETIFFEVVVHVRFWHSSARVVFFKHMVPPFPVAVFIPRLRPNDFVWASSKFGFASFSPRPRMCFLVQTPARNASRRGEKMPKHCPETQQGAHCSLKGAYHLLVVFTKEWELWDISEQVQYMV